MNQDSSGEDLSQSRSNSRSRSKGSNKLRTRSKGSTGSLKNISQAYSGSNQPDPNRYMKYLSLRNRKGLEPYQQQKGLETGESSMSQPISNELREGRATLDSGDNTRGERNRSRSTEKSLSPAHKRPRDHSASSKSSLKADPKYSGVQRDVRQDQQTHSPLRVKTLSGSQLSKESHHRESLQRSAKENKWTPTDTQQKPVEFPIEPHSETSQRKGALKKKFNSTTSTQPRFKNTAERRFKSNEFGLSTNDDETDFYFDFDQEGEVCSYVNTTQQSEERREQGTMSQSRKQSNDFMGPIQEASKESYNADETSASRTKLRECRRIDEQSEESSGYIVDYEQMLKDSKSLPSYVGMVNKGFRHNDIGQEPILEQAQANETSDDSAQPSQKSPKFVDSQRVKLQSSMQGAANGRNHSPESQRSDNINSVDSVNIDTQNHQVTDYKDDRSSPQKEYQNRRPSKSNVTRNIMMNKRRGSSERDRKARSRQGSGSSHAKRGSKDQREFRNSIHSRKSQSTESFPDSRPDTGPTFRDPNLAISPVPLSSQNDAVYFQPLKQSEQGSPQESARKSAKSPYDGEYDLASSNKRMRMQADEIEKESQEICMGYKPCSSLAVTCVIRNPTNGKKRANQSPVNLSLQRRANSQTRQGRNYDPTPYGLRSSRSNLSYGSSNRYGGRMNSVGAQISRVNRKAHALDVSSVSGQSVSAGRRKRANSNDQKRKKSANKTAKMQPIKNTSNNPNLLSTFVPSKYLVRGPPGLLSEMLKILLQTDIDVYNCQQALDEGQVSQKNRKSMKIFEFENCISEPNGHSIHLGLQQQVKWINQSSKEAQGPECKNVILLFGQTDANKHQLLNVMNQSSIINMSLVTRSVKFLRVSMFHMGQEYLLSHRTFGTKVQMRREIGMEIREAYRERDLNAKKIALKLSTYAQQVKAEDVRLSCHLMIQLDNLVFFDLADIDNLKDPQLAKKISSDFSAVTNAILSLSPYYKDHSFANDDSQQMSPFKETNNLRSGSLTFKQTIQQMLSKNSRILLICCVTPNSMAGTQAVDYCHKISAYFKGQTDDSQSVVDISHVSKNPDLSMDTENQINAIKQLSGLISEVTKTKAFIDKMFLAKRQGERMARDRQQLKEMVEALRDDVGDLLSALAASNEQFIPQFTQIKRLLQMEILEMNDKIACMRSISRGKNSVGSGKYSSSIIAFLPKKINTSTVNIITAKSQVQTPKDRNGIQDSKQQLHTRPKSQTSFSNVNAYGEKNQRSGHKHRTGCNKELQEPVKMNRESSKQSIRSGSQKQIRPAATVKPYQEKKNLSQSFMQTSVNQRKKPASLSRQNLKHAPQGVIPMSRRSRQSTPQNSRARKMLLLETAPHQLKPQIKHETQVTHDTSKLSHSRVLSKSPVSSSGKLKNNKQMKKALQNLMRDNQANHDLANVDVKLRQLQHESDKNAKELMNIEIEQLSKQLKEAQELLEQATNAFETELNLRQSHEQRLRKYEEENELLLKKNADLEDRVIAKEQTIRSLESQLDFLRNTKREPSPQRKEPSPKKRDYSNEMRELKAQKAETDGINRQILGQIGILKDAIQGFQNQEKFNQKLLLGQKRKDKELKELREQIQQLQVHQIQQAQMERSQGSYTQQTGVSPNTASNSTQPRYHEKPQKDINARFYEMQQQIEHLSRARDQYREQTIELKHELRKNKTTGHNEATQGSYPNNLLREQRLQGTGANEQSNDFDNRRSLRNRSQESREREPQYNHTVREPSGHERPNFDQRGHRESLGRTTAHQTDHSSIQNQSLLEIKSMIREIKEDKRPSILRPSSSGRDLAKTGSTSYIHTGQTERENGYTERDQGSSHREHSYRKHGNSPLRLNSYR